MALTDYLIPVGQNTNICFNCQKACGDCSWSAIDPATKKPKFEPVPGWTAKKVMLNLGRNKTKNIFAETYHITACPEFVPDLPRNSSPLELSDIDFIRMKARKLL